MGAGVIGRRQAKLTSNRKGRRGWTPSRRPSSDARMSPASPIPPDPPNEAAQRQPRRREVQMLRHLPRKNRVDHLHRANGVRERRLEQRVVGSLSHRDATQKQASRRVWKHSVFVRAPVVFSPRMGFGVRFRVRFTSGCGRFAVLARLAEPSATGRAPSG